MSKKFSSFDQQQLIMERFRQYLKEGINEAGYYGLGADDSKQNKPDPTPYDIAEDLGLEGEEAKGYAVALKHVGKYGINQMNPRGDKMAPDEFNKGWEMAYKHVKKWEESKTKQEFWAWVLDQQGQLDDPHNYEDADDAEYARYQNSDDYTRSE